MTGVEPNLVTILLLKTGVFIWLSIWTFVDIIFHYKQRSFFITTLGVINLNKRSIRGDGPLKINNNIITHYINQINGFFGRSISNQKEREPQCPALESCGTDPNICPIMRNLSSYLSDSDNDSSCINKNINQINDVWNIVRRSSVIRPQQAAFLELLIIQIFVIVFWPVLIGEKALSFTFVQSSSWIGLFSIALIILFSLLVMSYINSRPLFVYENRAIRFILVSGSWMVFYAYLQGYLHP
jgi:hypothetical protein